ncbi:TRIP4 isoform 8 [Pongo abelii]|uniref:TRIP4 isoform 8 n=1 Tax=Pongo abelii TaxID=9601 RepID=A0A2J8T8B0_PONAB|nr:TRIP4 isoform 8 [Pongo abelii]
MAVAGAVSGEPLVNWCTQQLRKTFGLDVSEEIIQEMKAKKVNS